MAACLAYIQQNMVGQQNDVLSWLVEALRMVRYFAEQRDDWAERRSVFRESLNKGERDVRRYSPWGSGDTRDTGESNTPRVQLHSREQNRNCDLGPPVSALSIEIGASVNSLGSRHFECCRCISGSGDHDTFVRLHVAYDARELAHSTDIDGAALVLTLDDNEDLVLSYCGPIRHVELTLKLRFAAYDLVVQNGYRALRSRLGVYQVDLFFKSLPCWIGRLSPGNSPRVG